MNEAESIRLFRRWVVGAVRQMPLFEARAFLRGLLTLTEDRPEVATVRDVYTELCVVDDRLALLAARKESGEPAEGTSQE